MLDYSTNDSFSNMIGPLGIPLVRTIRQRTIFPFQMASGSRGFERSIQSAGRFMLRGFYCPIIRPRNYFQKSFFYKSLFYEKRETLKKGNPNQFWLRVSKRDRASFWIWTWIILHYGHKRSWSDKNQITKDKFIPISWL